MFFDLFGKNKDEFITAYAGKLAEAVLEDALDEDVLEELIHYAKEKDLSNKQLASAQAMACDKVFEELYQEGYITDEDYELYQSLIEACYMMKEKEKYRYQTIAKRCNAIYKIQEEGLLPKINPDYANVKYREGEALHFAASAKLMKLSGTNEKGLVISKDSPFRAGSLKDPSNGPWKEDSNGALWITTERIGFRGKKDAFTLEIADLDHAELDHGPLRFFEKGKEMPKAVRIDDYEMAGVILTNLLQR